MGTSQQSIEIYAKTGGFGRAIRDFWSVEFTSARKDINRVPLLNVENYLETKGNKVWIGDKLDTRIELQRYHKGDKAYDATIYIRKPWTSPQPQKIIYYKARPKTGSQ